MSYTEIKKKLVSLKNDADAKHAQRFFKTAPGEYGHGDTFLGIRMPVLRKVAKQYPDLSLKDIQKLLHDTFHEIRLFALILLVNKFEKTKNSNDKEIIVKLYLKNTAYINNWDLVDVSAHKIVGAYLLDKTDRSILYTLATSKNLWERRIAIVATYWFIKHTQYADTIEISKILLNDSEDLIHKAVGWMLREVGKCNKKELISFLDVYAGSMPRTALRYSLEKCTKEEKEYYMKQ